MTRIAAVLLAVVALATASDVGWLEWAGQHTTQAHAMVPPGPISTSTSTVTSTPTPTPTSSPSPAATARPKPCSTARRPFTPRTISIAGATRRAGIVTPARVGRPRVIPGAPPLTRAGKELVAWDKPSGIRPGDRAGNVRLNAHTWPNGTAVGNRMLKSLQVGDRIVVYGATTRLCYRVTARVQVLPTQGLRRYYRTTGRPQLAIVVCSGRRLAGGYWTKRTIWYASPIA